MQALEWGFVSGQRLHRLTPTSVENGICGGHARKRVCCLSQHDCGKHVEGGFRLGSCQRLNVCQRWRSETFTDDMLGDREIQFSPSLQPSHCKPHSKKAIASPKTKIPRRIAPRGLNQTLSTMPFCQCFARRVKLSLPAPASGCPVCIHKADERSVTRFVRQGPIAEVHPLGGRACVEKLGYRSNQLRWSKRFLQQNAVGHSL